MADTDTTLPLGVELPVRLVIGDDVISAEVGTVTLDPGDTPDKIVAEFLHQVAEEITRQSEMAKEMIAAGMMKRVEVDPRFLPGTTLERGTPEALDFMIGDRRVTGVIDRSERLDLNLKPCPCAEGCEQSAEQTPGAPGHELPVVTSYSCGGECACQPTA